MHLHKSWYLIAWLLVFLSSCSDQGKMEQFGQKLTLKETTEVSAILAQPESFLQKKVRIEGTIVDVCQNMGCWLEIAGSEPGQKLKVKVNDGEIIFPVSAKGKRAIVEGEPYKIELDQTQAIAYLEHLAEEKGEPFDATAVTGPLVIYQIQGQGALIETELQ